MASLHTLARLAGREGAPARSTDGVDPGAAAPPVGVAERCRRCEALLARWVALTGRPGEDLDPDGPAGREALGVRELLDAELRSLEDRPARTEAEVRAKVAVGMALVRQSGAPDFAPRFHAFLLAARAEAADLPARMPRREAHAWTWLLGFLR